MLKLKLVLAALISILPINALRVFGYRLLGYKVNGRVGFGTVIAVSAAHIGKCKIGLFNLFVGPMQVEIGEGASIRDRNTFSCGFWTTQEQYKNKNYARCLRIGANALITSGHYFDVAGSFELDDGSWIAGIGSQFWTHGAGVTDRDIRIGRDCYLGSAVRFAPGTTIGEHVIVAMGSVVTKKFDVSKAMIGGVPATVLKKDYDWKLEEK
jgi:acetyltransferase-like isoleucine patch superfamily enzyme